MNGANFRTLKLSHDEIELVEEALESRGILLSKQARDSYDKTKDARFGRFKKALHFMDLAHEIKDGRKDV